MAEQNFTDLGRQLSETVQEALRTGDYSQIKHTVTETMKTVVNQTVSPGSSANRPPSGWNRQQTYNRPNTGNTQRPYVYPNRVVVPPQNQPMRPYLLAPQVGSAGKVVELILAVVLTFVFILGTLSLIPDLLLGLTGVVSFTGSAILLLGSIGLMIHAICGLGRVGRYKIYCRYLAGKNYCSIEEFSKAIGKSPSFVVKDIKKMLMKGWFPQGHLDNENKSLMVGEQLYRHYLAAEAGKKQRELIQAMKEENPDSLEAVIAEGKEWVQRIRRANDELPGEIVSAKLNRLEIIVVKIFAYVEKRPNKLPEIRRFMNYYLPTTGKLVDAYCDFERQPVQVENILTAKQEILDTLDTINTAFESLLDDLYQDDALDISTDISALKTVLAQDGLVEKKIDENQDMGNL